MSVTLPHFFMLIPCLYPHKTGIHRQLLFSVISALSQFLRSRSEVLSALHIFVYRFQDMPWRINSTGLLQHFIHCGFILIPFFTVSPVLICDLPLFFRIVLAVIKSCKLGIFINVDPEFHDHSTPVGKFLLEFIDLIVCTSPVVLTAKPSSLSTITLPYQVRSNMAMCPSLGNLVQKRHR